jgi:uncharacterized protein YrrD
LIAQAAKFIGSQRSDQYLASNFKGTDVLGADNKKIGDVSDILFNQNGKVLAYVVSVGGFLGIGSKDVALDPSVFAVVAGDKAKHEADKLKLAMSQAESATLSRSSKRRLATGSRLPSMTSAASRKLTAEIRQTGARSIACA